MTPLKVSYVQANGDCAVLIFFKPHPQQTYRLQTLAHYIRQQRVEGIVDVVPALDSLMLMFDQPIRIDDRIMSAIEEACEESAGLIFEPQIHEIPVCYHPQVASDLNAVLKQTGLGLKELIASHSQVRYTVSFLGFLPGFAYLSGLPKSLHLNRKPVPGRQTPAGSVAIANRQTGLYALNSPAGWYVIGCTPVTLFDRESPHVLPYQPLDIIKFKPINLDQFEQERRND